MKSRHPAQRFLFLPLLAAAIIACQDLPPPPTDVTVALAASASGSPFVGSWENTDPLDGSHQHLTVGKGPKMPVRLRDDAATICNESGFGFVPASIDGFAVIRDDDPFTFEFTGDVYCYARGPGGRQVVLEDLTLAFTYNPETDTLSPDCWHRSGSPESCA